MLWSHLNKPILKKVVAPPLLVAVVAATGLAVFAVAAVSVLSEPEVLEGLAELVSPFQGTRLRYMHFHRGRVTAAAQAHQAFYSWL
jgi:hypothetical protein